MAAYVLLARGKGGETFKLVHDSIKPSVWSASSPNFSAVVEGVTVFRTPIRNVLPLNPVSVDRFR